MSVYCSLDMTSRHNLSLQDKMDFIKGRERGLSYRELGILTDSASFVSVLEHATAWAAYVYRPVTVEARWCLSGFEIRMSLNKDR